MFNTITGFFKELKAKLDFNRARKLNVNDDYTFYLDGTNTDAFTVEFLTKYPKVIVEYSNIHMSEDNILSFDIDVIANYNCFDTKSSKFKKFTSDVMRSIINSSIETFKESNENGNIDSQKFTEERAVHEEGDSVPEARVSARKPRKKAVRRSKKIRSKV